MSILREELITNHLLLDYFDMWDEFDIHKVDDPKTIRYYNLLENHINNQIDATIRWLESDEARDYFFDEAKYQKEILSALEDEWDEILSAKYPSVDALLDEVYRRGKAKGYADMREHIKFSEADKIALNIARNYNYHLIRKIDNDTRSQIKSKITEAVVTGEHPDSVARKIRNVAEEKLHGTNFTPKQRATMIARTEISRVQNTGILQSYINEGYTEVKILTAGDSRVCNLCLQYAFEFEEEADITYDNRGEERTHNIIKLIKGGNYPPFHPLCRCTYLSVWHSKGEPPENPYIINLTPMRFSDSGDILLLPDGKPNIRWTEDDLRESLSGIVDSKKELDNLVDGIMKYMNTIENRNKESLSAMDMKFKMVCKQHSLGEDSGVNLCDKGKTAAKKRGLLFIIHNHPSNNPLQSKNDIMGFAKYNAKYNIVYTEEQGLFILKNKGADAYDIRMSWNDIFQKMKEHYRINNPESYNAEYEKYNSGIISRKQLKKNIYNNVIQHMSENLNVSKEIYEECMSKRNIGVFNFKP